MSKWLKLVFFVPEDDAESVKTKLFKAGAGQLGEYDQCSWESSGTGQFRPSANANPTLGKPGALTRVPELRIEVLVAGSCADLVQQALIDAHPYETPAFEWHQVYLDYTELR